MLSPFNRAVIYHVGNGSRASEMNDPCNIPVREANIIWTDSPYSPASINYHPKDGDDKESILGSSNVGSHPSDHVYSMFLNCSVVQDEIIWSKIIHQTGLYS